MNRQQIVKPASIIAIIIVLLLVPVFVDSVYWVSIFALIFINILLTSSLRTIKLLDHISLGHVGFTLIGAYGSALLVMKGGLPFWLALVTGGLMAALVALALGYPFLKVKGMYFAILTLLTAETFRAITYYWRGFTGGQLGLLKIPPPSPLTLPGLGTISFDAVHNYYYVILIVVLISLFIIYRLERSYISFKWQAIRDADNLAHAVGINVAWYKMVNFVIACFFAGIAGGLFAHFQHNLSADATSRFGVWTTLYLIVYMVVGGEAKFFGPIIGTLVLALVGEFARSVGEFRPMVIGGLAILIVLFMPGGLISLPDRVRVWYRAITKKKGELAPPRPG